MASRTQRTVYVVRNNFEISCFSNAFKIRTFSTDKRRIINKLPAKHIGHIVAIGHGSISTAALELCARYGVALTVMRFNGAIVANLFSLKNSCLKAVNMPAATTIDKDFCFILGKKFCTEKITAQLSMLRAWQRRSPQVDFRFEIARLAELLRRLVLLKSQSLESLRGLEGLSASSYFSCLRVRARERFSEFYSNCRTRRPPLDFLNCLLSFAYSLLIAEVSVALISAGLALGPGFLHNGREHGRRGLVLDFMEPYRISIADRTVLRTVNRGQINVKSDFYKDEIRGGFYLTESGKRTLVKEFERTMTTISRLGKIAASHKDMRGEMIEHAKVLAGLILTNTNNTSNRNS